MIAQGSYIKASNPGANDEFGGVIAVSHDGNTMVVGASLEDSGTNGINSTPDNLALDAGAAYVFVRAGSMWTQQAYIKASNSDASDRFGFCAAISADGNTLAIGAVLEDSGAVGINGNQVDNLATNAGAVYVFTRTGTTWTQQAYIKASNTALGDEFGYAIAISADGNTLAVDAVYEDSAAKGIGGSQIDNTAASAGAVYVFSRTGTVWSQQAYVKASNTAAGQEFGYFLDFSDDGNTLAAGAPLEDSAATGINGNQTDVTAVDSGSVYVFTRTGTTWSQQAYVKASNTGAGDNFGYIVSLSGDGNTLAVGAPKEDSAATGVNGSQVDNPATMDSGAAYVFARVGTTWSQEAYVKASNTEATDIFGARLTLSKDGTVLGVSAVQEDSKAIGIDGDQADNSTMDSGAVYMYSRTGSTWSQTFYVKASNTEAGDRFGYLTMSGTAPIVGAVWEDSASPGINGVQTDNTAVNAGAVYTFE